MSRELSNKGLFGRWIGTIGLFGVVLLLVASTPLQGQSTHGSIVGTITDATNAVLPGVSVVVINKDTNFTRTVLTNDSGYYEATALLAGTYRVQAEFPGFKTMVREGIVLESRAIVRMDLRMEIGEQSTSIEVAAVSPVIQSETASLSDLRTADHLEQLPSLGTQNLWNVVVTMPGVQTVQGRTIFSFNGARGAQSEIMFDGINTPRLNTALAGIPNSTEATDEMQIHAANNNAEFASPGVVNMVSRSGGNALHGTLYYYHTDDKLNSKNPFQATKARLKRHDFGAVVGGPVVLPKLYNGRDRTFFMVTLYGNRVPGDASYGVNVPTLAMRGGDFSKSGVTNIIDPATRQPFPGNVIPAARLNSVSLKMQERFFGLPNNSNPDALATNLRGSIPGENRENRIDVRIDHKISDKNFFYVRYNWRGQVNSAITSLPSIGLNDGYRGGKGLIASDTHLFTPNLINEFRFGFQKSPNRQIATQDGNEIVGYAGIQGIDHIDYPGMPTFQITGFTNILAQTYLDDMNQIHQATDNLTWVHGSHSFKAGADMQYNQAFGPNLPNDIFGIFNFSGFFTGYSYADFMLGYPLFSRRASYRGDADKHGTDMAVYFQDSWRLTPKLTFEWGVRYERQFASVDDAELMYNLDPATGNLVVPDKALTSGKITPLLPSNIKVVSASEAGFPQALRNPQTGNFVPRFGLAFRPMTNTVVRAGYGMFIDTFGTYVTPPQAGPLYGVSEEFRNTNRYSPTYVLPNPFVGAAGRGGTLDVGTNSYPAFDVDLRNPRIHQWNLTLERQLGEIGVRLSYIGTASRELLYRRNLNVPAPSTTPYSSARKPLPQYANVYFATNGDGIGKAGSDYHAMQFDVEKRFGSGLYFQGAWTWSKLMSDLEDARSEFGPQIENPYDLSRERAVEAYSPRHRVTGSAIWELPIGRGQWLGTNMPGVLDTILGQWSLSSYFVFETGSFFTPYYTGTDSAGNTGLSGLQHSEAAIPGLRPDRIADGNLPSDQRTQQRWYDPSAFVIPAANIGRMGNSGRNVIEGPGLAVVHAALGKRFVLREGTALSFQINANNVFNHTNLSMPNNALNLSNPGTVGRITGTRGGLENGGPRTIVLEMRLRF